MQTLKTSSTVLESVAQAAIVVRGRVGTTPGLLRGLFGLICVAAFVCSAAWRSSIAESRRVVQVIGSDSVPSIIAAEEIGANLADMDASAANGFLTTGSALQAARDQYENDRKTVVDRLVTAAQNITYGDEERLPIRAIAEKLQVYVGLIETARSKGAPNGIEDLRTASKLMHDQILPNAQALDLANFRHLDREYTLSRGAGAAALGRIWFWGLFLAAALIATQVFLTVRTRRVFNLPLAVATFMLVGFMVWLSASLSGQRALMRVAKQDCFDSIHALWKARAVGYDANGDESLYLLANGRPEKESFERSFRNKTALLVDASLTDQLVAQAATGRVEFHGYLGDELRNITFQGEKEAALDTLRWFGQYMDIDRQIRALEQNGRHQEAIDLCVGMQRGQSNWAFDQFDSALGRTLEINQKEFDAAILRALYQLRNLPFIPPAVALAIAALSWFGLQPRIGEYRG